MNTSLKRPITAEEIETFDSDGVVMLKQMFDADWIALLDKGLSDSMTAPTDRSRVWDRDEAGRAVYYDSQAWTRIEEYRQFVVDSPCAEIAGRLLRASSVNFFFDAVFVRSPGTQFATPWHQDEPYWTVDGYDTCSIWMPLVPVTKESALAFVPGSHKGNRRYIQRNFGDLNPDRQTEIDQVDFSGFGDEPLPDIDADPAAHNVTSWAMQPGDCVAFNGRVIHGGSGKLAGDRDLRVFNTKWLGDDVRIKFRDHGMDPDHSAVMTELGLKPGDRVGTDVYPEVWRR
mgnify:CR=1 FL=1